MNKKTLIMMAAAVLIVAAGAVVYFVYSASDYSLYSNAFKKTFNVSSMDLNTAVQASADGAQISSAGSFKLKDMNTNTPQFINEMTIGGQTIVQFCDGQFIYTDDGTNKNKISLGSNPQPRQEKEQSTAFTFEDYISEFSGLLDASKIRELNSMEPVAEQYVDSIAKETIIGGAKFNVTLLPQAVDELVDSFLNENLSNPSLAPTVAVNSVMYSASVSDGFVSEIAFDMNLNVTAPGESEAKETIIRFTIRPVNPGQVVDFTLPGTEGF